MKLVQVAWVAQVGGILLNQSEPLSVSEEKKKKRKDCCHCMQSRYELLIENKCYHD